MDSESLKVVGSSTNNISRVPHLAIEIWSAIWEYTLPVGERFRIGQNLEADSETIIEALPIFKNIPEFRVSSLSRSIATQA